MQAGPDGSKSTHTPTHADELLARAVAAAEAFRLLDQEAVDRIVAAAYRAAYDARIPLARLAFDETGIGVFEHKVVKNAWASLLVYEDIRHRRTVGILSDNAATGITEVAHPRGPVLATVPVTNPTSTAIFKILIALKTRNPLIISPHGGARRSIRETARILEDAAIAAGAPADCVQVITKPQKEHLEEVMRHPKLALILATGTGGIVRMAELSGTPTIGVGPGNVPVYIHEDADLEMACRFTVHSKTFDNGTVCASEQALVIPRSIEPRLRHCLMERGSHFCSPEETTRLDRIAFDPESRSMRADVVGRSAVSIAQRCGFQVPERTRLLIAEPLGVGREHPLSHEILAPILAYYVVDSYEEALQTCAALNRQGGIGHTVGLYTEDEKVIRDFAFTVSAGRICVNQPTTQGAIGGLYNVLRPSLTLGCGTGAGNITTDNVTTDHLLEIHRVARRRENARWMAIQRATFLDPDVGSDRIERIYQAGA
ncbi:MAG: aldehyde dehydrogenase family protein [Candidatus Eisenbacteria bacterium]